MRGITIGQYYQADSPLHLLDPRVKLLCTLAYIIILFFADNPYAYGLATIFAFAMVMISTVPVRMILRGMRAVLFLALITVLFNLFLTPGDVLVEFWIFTITRQGAQTAAMMALRLFLLVLASSVMTLTTTPNKLTDALERGMRPLKIFRVPVHEIAMMMSIALRFIPILSEETEKIMNAQMARGAAFDEGNVLKRAKSLIPLLVPLFVSSFRRAGDLALAMEARCYHGGKGRTRLHPLRYATRDVIAYLVFAAFLAGMIVVIRLF
ncbi:MAG: energy-coupling factor transporter transmembrane protein EcfT [Lachnospiraceae bacterium]|nr:energy-coupling factor transporter transmembrane protein EcfT [Lachnospiraceae bacterium]